MKDNGPPRIPGYLLPAAVFAALTVVMPFYAWHQDTSGFLTDDGLYLLMADFFSPWFAGNVYVENLTMTHARFPPAFPVLLGLFGGGSRNMGAAHLVTAACLLLSALLFYLWARRNLVWPPLALTCLLVFIMLPESLLYVVELRSELLYVACVFAALLAMDAARSSVVRERELYCLAAVLVGLCILTRTIGIALLAAFLIQLVLDGNRRKWLYAGLAAILPASWYLIRVINGYSNLYVEDLGGYLSGAGFQRLLESDIPHRAGLLLEAWNTNMGIPKDSSWTLRVAAAALLLPALVGFWRRISSLQPDTFYAVFYIAAILVWPYPEHMVRFAYPLIPLALVYVFSGLSAALRPRGAVPGWTHTAVAFTMLALVAANAIALIGRYHAWPPSHVPEDFRHTRSWLAGGDPVAALSDAETKYNVISLLKRVPGRLEPDDCVYAVHFPLAMLYSQRPAFGLTSNLSERKLFRCDYLFVMNLEAGRPAKYPLSVMDHGRLKLVDIEHDSSNRQQAYLFRLRR